MSCSITARTRYQTSPDFGSYRLELIGLGTGGKYIAVLDGTQPVASAGQLGQINLSSYPPDNYGLRLSVFDGSQQLQGSCLVNIILARVADVHNVVISGNTAVMPVPINVLPITGVVTTETFARTKPATNGALSITLTAGVVVNIDSQSEDGQWSHIVLDGGKNGWVLSSVLQFITTNVQAVAVPSSSSGTKGIVSVEQTVLRAQPDANARMIRTLGHNTTFIVTETSADGQWVNVTLPNGTQGWLLASEVQTEGVPQTAQPAILCSGTIGMKPAQVYSRPALSGSVSLGTLKPEIHVIILDVDDQSGNPAAWYYVQSFENNPVQGWVQDSAFTALNHCSLPSSPPDQFTVILPTLIPANAFSQATVVTPDANAPTAGATFIPTPTAYFDSILRSNLPVIIITKPIGRIPANTQVQIIAAGYSDLSGSDWNYQIQSADGTTALVTQDDLINAAATNSTDSTTAVAVPVLPATIIPATSLQVVPVAPADVSPASGICHMVNQHSDSVPVYSGPSSKSDESTLVNNLPPNVPAVVLYQQRNKQSGEVWYLVLAVMEQDKQISGWVSADSIKVVDSCPALP